MSLPTADDLRQKLHEFFAHATGESPATKQDTALLKQDLELLKKDLLLKLGSVMVGGFVVLSGIMLSVLSLLLN
ncbi:MAG: hypothetical protein IBGAMO2_480005 [Arenicellales bacterium IbO2]|nr:hypothetical protein [Gammaproteobacteria bacterium]CAJ2376823.1 MAG: hypothetical protein IBGAMO2_480005 [Arenicellales bacterium IbO2]